MLVRTKETLEMCAATLVTGGQVDTFWLAATVALCL